MQLIIGIFLFALTRGSLAFLNTTVTFERKSSLSAAWPEPEGLPDGWREGADVEQPGPFGRVLTYDSITGGRIRIYYPDSIGTGPKLPIVFFKHGFTAQSSQYRGIIDRLVTHGFVVVADDNGGTNPLGMANDVEATIKWFMDLTRGAGLGRFNRDNLDISRIGMTGHSMGGGATTYIIGRFGKPDHPLADLEPDFYFRGGAPCQPWTSAAVSKSTVAPMLVMGGTLDTIVPTSMYTGVYSRSADLKVLMEFRTGHLTPNGAGGPYTAQITDYMYATLLGDKDRWYKYFPAN